ncbi:MAG TPA: hypothetical protein VFR18_04420 [Terriglobia bacterium]|jgi:hypothetical protein|nr:hypothetical protein [Terriglobia bacterium]
MLEHYEEARERYEFQMGPVRGRLATALDILTDALSLVGQHGVYCRSTRQPQFPSMDVRLILRQIEDSKGLVIEAMEALGPRKNQA